MSYTKAQIANINAIIKVGKSLGASDRDIAIALATAQQESSFNNINYGDKAGPDSRGLFQQRNNWGTLADRMNPEKAARLFFLGGADGSPGLLKIKNRNNMTFGDAAYAVQHFSKQYISRYTANQSAAQKLVANYGGTASSTTTPAPTVSSAKAATVTTPEATAAAAAPQLSDDELASRYGYAVTFLRSIPEVYSIFKQAVSGQWTAEKFAGAFQGTQWYRTHGQAYRQAYEQQMDDPATWAENTRKQSSSIADNAAAMGVKLDAASLNKLVTDSLVNGWTDNDLKNHLGLLVQAVGNTGHYGGTAGDMEGDLRKMTSDYGQQVSDQTLLSVIRSISSGDSTENDYKAVVQKRAQDMYPGYNDELQRGMSLRDVADPYIESMAQTLELNPQQIELMDPTIQYAMMAKGAPGGDGKPQSFSMYDFQKKLRADPRWAKTKQAQDATSSAATKVLSDFGFFAGGA